MVILVVGGDVYISSFVNRGGLWWFAFFLWASSASGSVARKLQRERTTVHLSSPMRTLQDRDDSGTLNKTTTTKIHISIAVAPH